MSRRDVEEPRQRPVGEEARQRPSDRTSLREPRGIHPTPSKAKTGSRAAIVATAPAVMLAGFVSHPYIGLGPPDNAVISAAVVSDSTRWALAHLTVAVGSGLVILAFLAIRSYLRDAGEERWSALAFPFIVIGSTLFTVLPGMEFAPFAAARTGGDVQAAQGALLPWFAPVLATGALIFALGVLGFVKGIAEGRILSRWLTWLVAAGLMIMAVARFVPLGLVQLYVQGAAGIVALWPLAYAMWKHPQADRGAAGTDSIDLSPTLTGSDHDVAG